MINPQMPTLEECATNDTYNCIFNIWDGTYLSPFKFKLEFKLKQDSKNSTHSIFTYIPKLIRVKEKNKGKNENYLNTIKNKFISLFSSNTSDTSNVHELREVIDEYKITDFSPTKDTNKKKGKASSWTPNIGRFFCNKKILPKTYLTIGD